MIRWIKGGILAGIVLFIWGFVSWMVLPWHLTVLNTFKDEQAVGTVIATQADHSGMYMLPLASIKAGGPAPATPPAFIFASVRTEPSMRMKEPLLISLLTQVVAACLVGWMLLKTTGMTYWGRVKFVVLFALAAGVVIHIPYWNWFCFDTTYTGLAFADLLIGWFLAGLVLAKICKK